MSGHPGQPHPGGPRGPERSSHPEVEQTLRGLRRVPPGPATRERALEAFLSGDGSGQDEAPGTQRALPRPLWRLAPWVVAAGLFLLVLDYGFSSSMHWRVVDFVSPSGIEFRGRSPGAPDTSTLLPHGTLRTRTGSELAMQLDEVLRLRLRGDGEIDLPRPPGRWFGHRRTLRLKAGELYGTSAGHPLDFRLTLQTPEARAILHGTTFSVVRSDSATCFCLYEGRLRVEPTVTAAGAEAPVDLPRGQRIFVYRDGRAPRVQPMTDMETSKLRMMHDVGLAPVPSDR